MTDAAVRAFVERVSVALRNNGHADRADALLVELATPSRERPALFVIGEDKRGKSCLVNALLSEPELSPVGVEVVTGAPITFFAAEPRTAMVFRYGEQQPTAVDLQTAQTLATVTGNPGNVENIRAVAIGINQPLLAGVNLVDTPGVGGLESGHGALTLQSLRSADALLFVLEAGAQLRAAELDFLRRAAARVDTVILVLTKVDLHRGWRAILEDNRRILHEHAPRFAGAPAAAVSSLLARRGLSAEAAGDLDEARELRAESGIGRLEALIAEHVVARSDVLRDRNLVRAAALEVAGLERMLQERLAALGPAGSRQALEAERARLVELRHSKADWAQRLDLEVRRLALERAEEATRATLEIRRRYDERLRKPSKLDMDTMPGELIADLTALAGALNEDAADRLFTLIQDVLTDIDSTSQLRESLGTLTEDSLRSDLEAFSIGSHELAMADKLSVVSSFASGRSLGALGGATIGALLAPPVGIAVGFGIGGLFAFQAWRGRTEQMFATAFRQWMTAQISQAQTSINTTFARRMLDLQSEMRAAAQNAIERREAELTESLEAAEGLLQAEEAKRSSAEQALRQRVEVMAALRKHGADLLTGHAELRAESAVSGRTP